MYQVSDHELFGIPPLPPLPVDDDFTLQRCRDPGDDGIDDVLSWLGLGPSQTGGPMRGEDQPGGWGWDRGAGERNQAAGQRGTMCGQLMEMESEEYDYLDYNSFSSGLTSPDLDSEFFGKQLPQCPVAASAYHPWDFTSIATGVFSGFSDRPQSPYFYPDADCCFPVMQSNDAPTHGEFDSEAAAKVNEIARYLASFEVQSWSTSDHQMINSSMGFSSTKASQYPSTPASTCISSDQCQVKSSAMPKTNIHLGVFHPGYDDTCCGLESTMVNPNEVFPNRIDRSDHQYATRLCQNPLASRVSTTRHSQRIPSGTNKAGVSVLEALLRCNEPIDPNKGSGAALVLEAAELSSRGRSSDADAASEGVLKKLLTGRMKDDGQTRNSKSGSDGRRETRAGEEQRSSLPGSPKYGTIGPVENETTIRAGQSFGYSDMKQATEVELSELMMGERRFL